MLNRSLSFLLLTFCISLPASAETPTPPPAEATENAQPSAAGDAPANTAEPTETPANTDDGTQAENTTDAPAENSEGTETAATPEEKPAMEAKVAAEAPITKAPEPAVQKEESSAHGDEHAFTVENMWKQSSGPVRTVLGTLLFMLIAAMGVGLERLVTLTTAKSQSRKVAGTVGPLLVEGKTKAALEACKADAIKKSYLAHQLEAGLTEFAAREDHYGIEAVERAIDKHSIGEGAALRKGLNILATVGSTAPFVGLVGTIFGIINAFSQIGAEGGADLTTLAPAIGEALITTAFGIIVAIVGVWLFNYFTATIESITNDMAESAQELMDWCHKRVIPKDNAAK